MIDRNDPRLTAYALGEMNAAERPEFEKMLDPAAKAEVEAIQALGGKIRAEFAKSPAPALTDAQRASVAKAAQRRVPVAILVMPLAACLIAAIAFFLTRGPTDREPAGVREEAHAVGAQSHGVPAEPKEIAARDDLDEVFVDSFYGAGANPAGAPPGVAEPKGFQGPNSAVPPGAREATGSRLETKNVEDFVPPPITLIGIDESSKAPLFVPEKSSEVKPTTPPGQPVAVMSGPLDDLERQSWEASAKLAELVEEYKRLKDSDDRLNSKVEELRRRIAAEREGYDRIRDNPFIRVSEEDVSTFSIDVDTASYANVRRFLSQHQLPPADAVRIEEMVNYFSYGYEPPMAGSPHPFRIHVEVAACPWDATHRLARVAIKGKVIDQRERGDSNLVFLVDVSGSMDQPDKLPLVQASLRLLAENLGERDRVAIAVYAGAAGLVLPSTGDKRQVADAIDRLKAGGSTAGAAGIELAYQVATENFVKGGVNRVILCTDGDFNVGVSDDGSLTRMIEEKAKSGVFLSVLGFGTGNYQDGKMQQLADRGNGNHAYIDSILEARKVLGEEMSGTLVTIAKDVKIQLFFNPKQVAGFRLIGYENRLLAKQDFNDDTKDAGEIGAGHSVTALYEIVPAGSEVPGPPAVDKNPFVAKAEAVVDADALFQLKLRYKQPDGEKSEPLDQMVRDGNGTFDAASPDFRWASAVAAFGMTLRGTAGMGLDAVKEIAKGAAGDDKYRREFLQLVETAKLLKR